MKKLIFLAIFFTLMNYLAYCQYSTKAINPSYKYVANPGFVNITELTGAIGQEDTAATNSKYYFGVTNVFGYQINRNFFGGIGTGVCIYDDGQLIPVYLEYKFSLYLKNITPYLYADGGTLLAPVDFKGGSKIFINPGIGISRAFSSKLEGNLSAGIMVQSRSTLTRVVFVNFKAGITFRKNSFRMYKAGKNELGLN